MNLKGVIYSWYNVILVGNRRKFGGAYKNERGKNFIVVSILEKVCKSSVGKFNFAESAREKIFTVKLNLDIGAHYIRNCREFSQRFPSRGPR